MGTTLFMEALLTIVPMGLGCGTCCSPHISVFLSTYTMSHAQNVKKALKIFLHFFLGKLTAVVLICILSSLIGKKWIKENGYIGSFNLYSAVEIGMLLIGILLLFQWFCQHRKNSGCKDCHGSCSEQNSLKKAYTKWPTFGVGFIYGISPCTPMIVLIGYTTMLSIWKSVLLAALFTAVSSLSPMLFVVFIGGVLSQKMYEEIPKMVEWIRLACYVMFIVLSVIMLFTH